MCWHYFYIFSKLIYSYSVPLAKLKQNIEAVKRRHGFDTIKENYDAELEKEPHSDTSDSPVSSCSQEFIDENEEVCIQ